MFEMCLKVKRKNVPQIVVKCEFFMSYELWNIVIFTLLILTTMILFILFIILVTTRWWWICSWTVEQKLYTFRTILVFIFCLFFCFHFSEKIVRNCIILWWNVWNYLHLLIFMYCYLLHSDHHLYCSGAWYWRLNNTEHWINK